KTELGIDFPDMDAIIERKIKSSVEWVERYTGVYLYERSIPLLPDIECIWVEIPAAPIQSITISNASETIETATRVVGDTTYVKLLRGQSGSAVLGYNDTTEIPSILLEGCYKLLTYIFNNRDAYTAVLPLDIQMLL